MNELRESAEIFEADDVSWIHDGVKGEKELAERADAYVQALFRPFADLKLGTGFRALEIGPGLGYIMEGVDRYARFHGLQATRIIGLDIAAPMLEKAKARLGGRPFEFLHYDGIHIPLEDGSLDFVYSVACLQHIPKPYVYNLFFEIKRLLSPTGFSLLHLIGFSHMPHAIMPWADIVRWQVKEHRRLSWMHYYSAEELRWVLSSGTGFSDVRVSEDSDFIVVALSNMLNAPKYGLEHSKRDALAAAQIEVQQTTAALALEQSRRENIQEELADARAEVERLTASLAAVHSSTSWRVTKPLRRAKQLTGLALGVRRSEAGVLEQKPRKLTVVSPRIASTSPTTGADVRIKTSVPMLDANGAGIPRIGLGTLFLHGADCVRATETALCLGYRHIDTAVMYGNETDIGNAIKSSGIPRSELFVTTKVLPAENGDGDLQRSAAGSLQRLGLDYVDLLLLHHPNPEIPLSISIKALCDAKKMALTRHIGVSNFTIELFEEAVALAADHSEKLAANQCRYHPGLNQTALLGACRANSVAFVSYSPLGHGHLLEDRTLLTVARRVGKSPAQVLLRWNIQQEGTVAISKSAQPARLAENLEVFDFELSDDDMNDLFMMASQ